MQQIFVDHDLAIELKEAGFTGACVAFYDQDGDLRPNINDVRTIAGAGWLPKEITDRYDEDDHLFIDFDPNTIEGVPDVSAPIYQQVFDWFEEKHIYIRCSRMGGHWIVVIENFSCFAIWSESDEKGLPVLYPNKKQAWDKVIREALSILKERKGK